MRLKKLGEFCDIASTILIVYEAPFGLLYVWRDTYTDETWSASKFGAWTSDGWGERIWPLVWGGDCPCACMDCLAYTVYRHLRGGPQTEESPVAALTFDVDASC